jgi:hypothetical protein
VDFTVPESWELLEDPILLLEFAHSAALVPERSHLTATLNGQAIGSVELDGTNGRAVYPDEFDRQQRHEWVGKVDRLEIAQIFANNPANVCDEVVGGKALTRVVGVGRLVDVERIEPDGAHTAFKQERHESGVEEGVVEIGRVAVVTSPAGVNEDDIASTSGLGFGSDGIESDAFASRYAVAMNNHTPTDESLQRNLIDFLGVIVKVEWRIDMCATLATHLNRHEVEPVLGDCCVLGDVWNRVAGVDHGLGSDFSGKVYDANYLHEKKLLPVRQERNSMATHCFANI